MKNAWVNHKIEDEEVEELWGENPRRTHSELAEALGVTQQAISKRQMQNFVRKERITLCI